MDDNTVTVDFTNKEAGFHFPFYQEPLSVCPLCQRVGQRFAEYDNDMFLHVISGQEQDGIFSGPVWISDLCQPEQGLFTISQPAEGLADRIKHPWELKNNG